MFLFYMSTRGHRNSQRELPPKMAHKVAGSRAVVATPQYYQQYQAYPQQPYQPRIQQQIYAQDQYAYQTYAKQAPPPQTNDYRYLPPSKRPVQQMQQMQQPVQQQPQRQQDDKNDQIIKPPAIDPLNPPKSFNIIRRGNLPGLLFEQVFVKSDLPM